jgi:hypothetical protein
LTSFSDAIHIKPELLASDFFKTPPMPALRLVAMTFESRHVSTHIDRPAQQVYDYAADPVNLPHWAHGLSTGVQNVNGKLIVDSPMGQVEVVFAPRNEFGVLDHHVRLPSGETFYNPMRITVNGTGCEAIFTVRRQPGTTDKDFQRDVDAVSADLATLKRICEQN